MRVCAGEGLYARDHCYQGEGKEATILLPHDHLLSYLLIVHRVALMSGDVAGNTPTVNALARWD
jgi:hypothetical protein